jgi:hypothetical protein
LASRSTTFSFPLTGRVVERLRAHMEQKGTHAFVTLGAQIAGYGASNAVPESALVCD